MKMTITVNVRKPNIRISAFWKIIRLLNSLAFERHSITKGFFGLVRLAFERSVCCLF